MKIIYLILFNLIIFTILLLKLKDKKINKVQYKCLYDKMKKEILITKKSPPFLEVLNYYESFRAGCSKKFKKCA
jgi:hypothetical protein